MVDAAAPRVTEVALTKLAMVVLSATPEAPAPSTEIGLPTSADVNAAEAEVNVLVATVIAPSFSTLPSPTAPHHSGRNSRTLPFRKLTVPVPLRMKICAAGASSGPRITVVVPVAIENAPPRENWMVMLAGRVVLAASV